MPGSEREGVDETEGFGVGHDALFHLVHDVGEGEAAVWVGEGETTACAWVAEGACAGAEAVVESGAVWSEGVHHESCGEAGGHEEDLVVAVGEGL